MSMVRDFVASRKVGALSQRIRRENITYLSWQKLRSMESACEEVRDLTGEVVECGVALGGSAILLSTMLPDKHFHGYDVFETIPAPGEKDPAEAHRRYQVISSGASEGLRGDTYYGYLPDLYDRVVASFADHGIAVGERVRLYQGLFEDTLSPNWPISLAHIDCDWYDPVKLCLERLTPQLVPGALVIIDDYFDYGGCKTATDEFLRATPAMMVLRDSGHRVLCYQP